MKDSKIKAKKSTPKSMSPEERKLQRKKDLQSKV